MSMFFSELCLSILLALGIATPPSVVDATHGSDRLAVAADEQGGNFDPNGLTSSSPEGEGAGDAEEISLPPPNDAAGELDSDGA